MPDVIDLISSTPPLPSADRAEQSPRGTAASTAQVSFTQVPSTQVPQFTLSDFDTGPSSSFGGVQSSFGGVFDLESPAKKRRVSEDDVEEDYGRKSTIFQFSDDLDGLPPPAGDDALDTALAVDTALERTVDSDPIVFTSSAPQKGKAPKGKAPVSREVHVQRDTITIESDDGPCKGDNGGPDIEFSDLPDIDDLIAEQPKSLLSNRTASLLASLESPVLKEKKKTRKTTATTATTTTTTTDHDIDEDIEPQPQPRRKPKQTNEAKEAKVKARQREKQEEKDRKAQLKEQKAKEKQVAADLAQVNKSKVDKKESIPEMIVDMHSSFEETSVGNQAVEYMKRLGVEYTFFTGSMPGIVKWRRKVKARFNDALGYWEPCAPHVKPEDHVLCVLTAQEFVDLISGADTVEHHVQTIKRSHPDCKPIYLIEGLTVWMRKANNARNRAYQAEVRRQDGNPPPPATAAAAARTAASAAVSDDTIEDALLHLQVTHACLIHHTSAAPETAEWLKTFTEHISTIPYRRQVMQGNDSAFCMDVGQVKTGDDRQDTFVKMLQEVNRVTASMAYGVVERYPTVGDLVGGMERGGPALLEDVKKSANKNGALTDSRLGPAVSRRLYKVFMGHNPSSTDI